MYDFIYIRYLQAIPLMVGEIIEGYAETNRGKLIGYTTLINKVKKECYGYTAGDFRCLTDTQQNEVESLVEEVYCNIKEIEF